LPFTVEPRLVSFALHVAPKGKPSALRRENNGGVTAKTFTKVGLAREVVNDVPGVSNCEVEVEG